MFAPVCRGGSRQGRAGRYGIGPYMGCLRRRGVCGRGMLLPYMPSGNDRPNGIAAATRANVGRDALIPPGPAAAGMFPVLNFNGAAGVNARPTDRGNTAATRENATPAVHRRGGFHIRPVCGGAGFRGRDKSRPYGQIFRFRQTGRPQCLSRFVGEVRGTAGRADMESAPTWGVCGGAGFAGGACPSPTCRPGTTGQMGLPRPPGRT